MEGMCFICSNPLSDGQTSQFPVSTDVLFDASMNVLIKQDKFLSNEKNKSRFISMLAQKLEAANISVKQAQDDADVLIIKTALEHYHTNIKTIVVGEDVDLLILLIARTSPDQEIYYLKPGKGKAETKIYSSKSFDNFENNKNHILLIHAIRGCDTTSALFQIGKKRLLSCSKIARTYRIVLKFLKWHKVHEEQ